MNETDVKISRGEVFYITSKYDTIGSEQKSGRPAVVVSNNIGNENSSCVEICYFTLQEKAPLPTHIYVDSGPCVNSTVLCEQITTVSKERLGDYICRLPDSVMDKVDVALKISLGLDSEVEKVYVETDDDGLTNANLSLSKENRALREELREVSDRYAKAKEKAAQADLYKAMYDNLLDRLIK